MDNTMYKQLTKESLAYYYHACNKTQLECANIFKYSQPHIFKCMKNCQFLRLGVGDNNGK